MRRVQTLRSLVQVHDLFMTAVAWVLSFYLRYDFSPPAHIETVLLWSTPVAVLVFGLTYRWARLYSGIWRYASIPDLMRIARAIAVGTLVMLAVMFLATRAGDMPRSVMVIHPLLLGVLLGLPRLVNRFRKMRRDVALTLQADRRPILLIGAGDAAELLIRDAMRRDATFRVVGLLDDDPKKQGLRIHEVPVLAEIARLPEVIAELNDLGRRPDEVVISIPSAEPAAMRRIVQTCEQSGLPFRTAPALDDIVTGRVSIGELREVTIQDILGRARVRLDDQAIADLIGGRRVMVTGAGGSIGSELCRQIARFQPGLLVMFELSEFNLYEIDRELGRIFGDVPRAAVLGDVRSQDRVSWAVSHYKPDLVLHAAAYKHVPLVEHNPTEGILTNILGTRNVARACVEHEIPKFVMVSTDKAVNPVNVMGATKRLAEIYCQNLQSAGQTTFITVRFGNVLGSVGSVVPLFREQIKRGGPVTVTHPDMQRYFMTIPEASQLILQAGTLGEGGEIFVLDMGQPVRIIDLATDMIRLSGREVGKDIEIQFTGLRAGEKLFEELLYGSEELMDGGHEKIFLSRQQSVEVSWLEPRVDRLLEACRTHDVATAASLLAELVPEYRPGDGGVVTRSTPSRTWTARAASPAEATRAQ